MRKAKRGKHIPMKYILKEITPLGKHDLFIANYWPDNQMDFPLHFHKDY